MSQGLCMFLLMGRWRRWWNIHYTALSVYQLMEADRSRGCWVGSVAVLCISVTVEMNSSVYTTARKTWIIWMMDSSSRTTRLSLKLTTLPWIVKHSSARTIRLYLKLTTLPCIMKHSPFQDNSSLLKIDDIAMNHEAFLFQDNWSLFKTDDIAMLSWSILLPGQLISI